MAANFSQSTTYNRKRSIESKLEQIKISFSVRLMREENSFQMIPVLIRLEIFYFVTNQIKCPQFVHILCHLGRARDSQAEIPDKAGAPCQIELP